MLHLGVLLAAATTTAGSRVEVPLKTGDQLAVYGMEFGGDGALYVAGTFFGKVTIGKKSVRAVKRGWMDGFVAKLDPTGKVTWAVSTRGLTTVSAIAVSATGEVAIAGATEYIVGKEDGPATDWRMTATILVLDPTGKQVTRTAFASEDRSWVGDVAFASDGTVVACGGYAGKTTFGDREASSYQGPHVPSVDTFVVHLTSTGVVDWLATGGSPEDDRAESITLGPAGDVYVAGSFGTDAKFGSQKLSGPTGASHQRIANPSWPYLASYSPQGVLRWVKQVPARDFTYIPHDALVPTSTGVAVRVRTDLFGGTTTSHHDLLSVKADGTVSTRPIVETSASTTGAQGLVTVHVTDTELALDEHDASASTSLSLATRKPKVALEVRALARARDGRFALASIVGSPTDTERADRSISTSYRSVYPTITIGGTAAELVPKRAR